MIGRSPSSLIGKHSSLFTTTTHAIQNIRTTGQIRRRTVEQPGPNCVTYARDFPLANAESRRSPNLQNAALAKSCRDVIPLALSRFRYDVRDSRKDHVGIGPTERLADVSMRGRLTW